jgi:hypothetical protein
VELSFKGSSMEELLGNNILIEKYVLISSENMLQIFSHYKKYSAR